MAGPSVGGAIGRRMNTGAGWADGGASEKFPGATVVRQVAQLARQLDPSVLPQSLTSNQQGSKNNELQAIANAAQNILMPAELTDMVNVFKQVVDKIKQDLGDKASSSSDPLFYGLALLGAASRFLNNISNAGLPIRFFPGMILALSAIHQLQLDIHQFGLQGCEDEYIKMPLSHSLGAQQNQVGSSSRKFRRQQPKAAQSSTFNMGSRIKDLSQFIKLRFLLGMVCQGLGSAFGYAQGKKLDCQEVLGSMLADFESCLSLSVLHSMPLLCAENALGKHPVCLQEVSSEFSKLIFEFLNNKNKNGIANVNYLLEKHGSQGVPPVFKSAHTFPALVHTLAMLNAGKFNKTDNAVVTSYLIGAVLGCLGKNLPDEICIDSLSVMMQAGFIVFSDHVDLVHSGWIHGQDGDGVTAVLPLIKGCKFIGELPQLLQNELNPHLSGFFKKYKNLVLKIEFRNCKNPFYLKESIQSLLQKDDASFCLVYGDQTCQKAIGIDPNMNTVNIALQGLNKLFCGEIMAQGVLGSIKNTAFKLEIRQGFLDPQTGSIASCWVSNDNNNYQDGYYSFEIGVIPEMAEKNDDLKPPLRLKKSRKEQAGNQEEGLIWPTISIALVFSVDLALFNSEEKNPLHLFLKEKCSSCFVVDGSNEQGRKWYLENSLEINQLPDVLWQKLASFMIQHGVQGDARHPEHPDNPERFGRLVQLALTPAHTA